MYEFRLVNQGLSRKLQPNNRVNNNDVKIMFYAKNINEKEADLANVGSVENIGYQKSKKTAFVIHGWTNSYRSDISQSIKTAYLSSSDINVFLVDWSRLSKLDYLTARGSVGGVGRVLASFISGMVNDNLLDLDNVVIVGHSLGAHIAGCTGKKINGKVNTIVGKII